MELTIEQALQQGVAAHKEGKLQDAERLYRAIIQSQPLHPDANHNLGVMAVSVNKPDVALTLKFYDPSEDILPCEGMIMIFPASRRHSAVYGGKTDRVMIGVNFYSL